MEALRQQNPDLTDYEELYLHVFAPTLAAFAEWVLDEALRSGKKRLYFLARDGWLMYRLACCIAKERRLDIELCYLKVSRFALRRAEYHLLTEEEKLDMVCAGGIDVTLQKVMRRAALSEEEAREMEDLLGDEFGGSLGRPQLLQLKRRLKETPQFFRYMDSYSRACYPAAAGYLEQEGLSENIPCAVVDSGWIGTIQKSLEHLTGRKLEGYYFGLYELPKGADRSRYHGYYFMPESGAKRKVHFSNCLFEAVFSAPEGMTLSYEERGGRYAAVESRDQNPNGERMKTNERLVLQFAAAYLRQPASTKGAVCRNDQDRRKTVEKLLCALMGRPKKFEARIFGGFVFCDDVLEMQLQPVAAALPKEELKKMRFFRLILIKSGIRKAKLHESAWLQGSAAILDERMPGFLFSAELYRYFMYLRQEIYSG